MLMNKVEKSKFKIYLNTSDRKEKQVSLVEFIGNNEKVIGERKGEIDIVSSISELLVEKGLRLQDVYDFVPNTGPGSFTGLKIGVTVANILNMVLGRRKLDELSVPEYGGEPNISKQNDPK